MLSLVGDSLAVGIDPYLRRLVEERGEEYASDVETGAGVRSFPSSRLARLPLGKGAERRIVVVSLGGNDRGSTLPSDELARLVRVFVSACPGPVAWIDMPFPTLGDAHRPTVSEIWRASVRRVLDVGSASAWASERAADGVHLTPRGYQDLAARVWYAVNAPERRRRAGAGGALALALLAAGVVVVKNR